MKAKNLKENNEKLYDFDKGVLINNYPFDFPKYAFNLNYIAISFLNIVKLISINEDHVEILAFDKDIYMIIENDLSLYIILNDFNPEIFRIIDRDLNNLVNESEKEKIFKNEGKI